MAEWTLIKMVIVYKFIQHNINKIYSMNGLLKSIFFLLVCVLYGFDTVTSLCLIGRDVNSLNKEEQGNSQSCRIFLDHGDVEYHAEVFYPIAVLMTMRHWPRMNLTFVVDKKFAQVTGLDAFWKKHASEGVLSKIIKFMCCLSSYH